MDLIYTKNFYHLEDIMKEELSNPNLATAKYRRRILERLWDKDQHFSFDTRPTEPPEHLTGIEKGPGDDSGFEYVRIYTEGLRRVLKTIQSLYSVLESINRTRSK